MKRDHRLDPLACSFAVEVVDPWVPIRTLLLTRGELTSISFMFQLACVLLTSTSAGSVGEVTVEDWRRMDLRQRFGITSPCNELLGRNEIDVGESQDGVYELQETILAMLPIEEPGSVEEKREGSLAFGVMFKEVLSEDLLDGVSIFGVETTVSHGTRAAPDVLKGLHWDLPHSWMGGSRTGSDTAGVGHLVLEGVGP